MKVTKVICHKDGTFTYWSVYKQGWIRSTHYISDEELAAMSDKNRKRILKHLIK